MKGDGTHNKKRIHKLIYGKGMTPIEKNIIVVDEYGNKYEATYPKRAKGLVKNGRARFIAENKICLACPPKNELEDNYMSANKNNINANINQETPASAEKLSMNYVLEQIEKVQSQLTDLKNTVNNIGCVGDSDYNGEDSEKKTVHDEVGIAKIKAITEVFHHREESLQSLLAFYQKMYDDLSQVPSEREKIVAMLVGQLENSKVPDTTKDYIMETLQVALQDLSKNL